MVKVNFFLLKLDSKEVNHTGKKKLYFGTNSTFIYILGLFKLFLCLFY